MFSKSKLAFIAAIVAVTFAAPALAQSVDHTGTLFASHYDENGKQVMGVWAPEAAANNRARAAAAQTRGLYSYARVPAPAPAGQR
jgi:hypothetical protein